MDTWTVTAPPVNTRPDVTNPGNQSNTVGNSGVSLQIVASDPDGDALSYSASGLPASRGINNDTGLISGEITAAAGSFNVTVTVSGLSARLDLIVVGADPWGACAPVDGCIDASQNSGTQEVTFAAGANKAYYFIVDGYAGSTSTFDISVSCL